MLESVAKGPAFASMQFLQRKQFQELHILAKMTKVVKEPRGSGSLLSYSRILLFAHNSSAHYICSSLYLPQNLLV